MRKFISLLILVVSFTAHSQERATLKNLKRDKEVCKAFAHKSIHEIEDGILLVRLNFRQRQVDYLNSRKDSIGANRITKEAMKVNKKITNAFAENFDFCTVYFFKKADSKHLKNQDFDSLTFYDLSFNEIDRSVIQEDNYLIGEFGRIKDDTTSFYSDEIRDTSKEKPKSKTYYGGSKNGREAFIIMDRKFQQIRKPFPYFAGLEIFLSEGARFKKALTKINLKLHDYSNEVAGLELSKSDGE
ncbi:MAG: hypothetical protein AB8B56_13460 [Crocinitomicaceae bacterium]